MKAKLFSIRLVDFRSFEDEEIFLDDITVVVGPNNVGKTNILKAIQLFPPEVPIDITRDLRRRSTKETPELIYTLEFIDNLTVPRLDFQIPKKIKIKKTTSEWTLLTMGDTALESLLTDKEYYKNNSAAEITVGDISLQPNKIIVSSKVSDELKPQLVLLSVEEVGVLIKSEVNEVIRSLLPSVKNIWAPKDEDFISEDNPVDQLISTPTLPLAQLLTEAFQKNPSFGDYKIILQKGIASETDTFCQNVTGVINEIIKENWSLKPPIKLKITPRDTSLKVFFDQGGAGQLEPSFSSDGLIWLVSFFIRLGIGEIENNILLLDQPGDKLYPGGQKDLVRIIENLAGKNQIIYSTHSPFMITQKRLGRNVRIIDKKIDRNGNQVGFSKINNEIKQTDIRQSDLLNTALGFSWTDFVPVGEFNVLMEGKLDSAVVIHTERQKAKKSGKAEIDFGRIAVRGVGKASYINGEARKIKTDGKKVLGIFDSDWSNSTPDLETNEKIKLREIDSNWADIEDLIPTEYFKEIFKILVGEFGGPFSYRKHLDGPGRGKKIKKYLKGKETILKLPEGTLVNNLEMKLIDKIISISESDDQLPESFYKLNTKIIKSIIL